MLFKISEVAERLKVSETTVRRLIDNKKLGCHRVGGIRVSELHIQLFLDSTEVKAEDPNSPAPVSKPKPKKFPENRLKHIRLN